MDARFKLIEDALRMDGWTIYYRRDDYNYSIPFERRQLVQRDCWHKPSNDGHGTVRECRQYVPHPDGKYSKRALTYLFNKCVERLGYCDVPFDPEFLETMRHCT